MATPKRRLIPGGIELHPTDCALVVHYSVLEPNQQDPTPATKTIALKSLSTTTDLASLAADVAAKCKLIHPNKLPKVEQLLAQLVQRHAVPQLAPPKKPASSSTSSSLGSASTATSSSRQSPRVGGGNATASMLSVAESVFDGRWDMTDDDLSPPPTSSSSPTPSLPPATLDQLDAYLDLLYEDLPAKLESTRSLLSLALTPSHLPHLAANDSLLPALARTLREDTKRSMHLSATILAVMHQFARHAAFRDVLKANKVGDLCLRQLELEVHRTRVLAADGKAASVRHRQDAVIYEAASVLVQLADDEAGGTGVQAKMVKRGIVGIVVALLEGGGNGEQRHPAVVALLLQVLASLTRFKESVGALLAGGDAAVAALIDMLVGYASPSPAARVGGGQVQAEALKVLLNVSHDAEWRAEMMRMNLVARLAGVLKDAGGEDQDEWVPEVLLVMYQLSCDDRSRAVFTYTEAMPIVRKLVLKAPLDHPPGVELMTLAINLALNEHNAEQFAENGGLKTLVKRFVRTRDYLVLKLVRNLSLHAALHLMFVDHLDDLVSTFLSSPSPPDLLVELIGTLANLRHPSLNFSHLLLTYPPLLPLLTSTLAALKPSDTLTLTAGSPATRGAASDDLALESIHLVTTLALDPDTAPMLAAAGVPRVLLGVLRAREDDDEVVLQALLAFSHLLMLAETRAVLLPAPPKGEAGAGAGAGGLVAFLIDLMYDRNAAIRAACMRCLDVICDLAEAEAEQAAEPTERANGHEQAEAAGAGGGGAVRAWADLIRTERFHFHNAEWLAAMAGAGAGAHVKHVGTSSPAAAQWHDEDDEDDDLSIAIREGKRSPKHLDHDDGGEHHAADMYGHVKLVYA